MSNKTFTADKIKTNEICGIDGGSVTICGIDNNNFPTISGGIISGENLLVSGNGNSLATFNSGVFNELVVNGVRYVPRNQIAYGFYFGGPPVGVPNNLPGLTGALASSGEAFSSDSNTAFLLNSPSGTSHGSTTFTDSSSHAHSITAYGDVIHSTGAFKYGDSSIYFDGSGDYLSISGSSNIDFNTGDFTIEAWVRPEENSTMSIFGSLLGDSSWSGWGLVTRGADGNGPSDSDDANCRLYWVESPNTTANSLTPHPINTGPILSLNTWSHAAVSRSGGTLRLFLNGDLKHTATSTYDIENTSHGGATIGKFYTNTPYHGHSYYFKGYMEDVRVSNVARYTSNFTPDETIVGFTGISGLDPGTKVIYVEDGSSFNTGDHVIIGGLYDQSENQENHTISGIVNYYPTNCCNSKVYANRSIGQNRIYYHEEREVIGVGDKIRINEDETVYTVTSSYSVPGELKFVDLTPNLTSGYQAGECICITPDTLLLESNLSNNYTGGTKVAKKYASGDACFDTSHLYLEKGMYKNQNFDWYMTGYRQSFIDFSGVQVHITGQSTSGLLTLQYPDV